MILGRVNLVVAECMAVQIVPVMRTSTLPFHLPIERFRTAATIFLLLLTFLWAGVVQAAQVDESTARDVAIRVLHERSASFTATRSTDLQLVYTKGGSTTGMPEAPVLFRVFNASGQGFVIVAGDDLVFPVLGYSTETAFPSGELLPSLAKWLEGYASEISAVLAANGPVTNEVVLAWQEALSAEPGAPRDTEAVSPLMQTKWDQAPNVNALCPGGSVTGCVATAMAQVMKYHNHPAQGAGFHSYSAPNYGTLSANFAATTYNWSGMPNIVTGANNAVATLMYHCGVSVDMQYSPQVSNAYMITSGSPIQHCTEYALKTYFGYDPSMQGKHRDQVSESQWITMLKAELDASRPVIYAGFGSGGGHCFVTDGYDNNNFFHFNWGWGGQADGYFTVGALNPGSTGTGGGTGGYNSGQQALIGIKPSTGGGGGGGGTGQLSTLALYNYVTPTSSTLYYGQAFSVSTNIVNNSTSEFQGDYAAGVFDASSNFYGFVGQYDGNTLPAGYSYNNDIQFTTTGLFSMVPGSYLIGILYRPTGGEWVLVANNAGYTNLAPVNVINPNDIEVANAITVSPGTTVVQGGQISVNLNVQNDGFNTFVGQYGVALYNLDGSWAQDVGLYNETGGLPSGYSYLAPYLTLGPVNVTIPPGTYLLAAQHNPNNTGWQLTGSSYFANPIFVTVTGAAVPGDQYEVNNTAGQAFTLPVTFSGSSASVATSGSTLHNGTDQDFYKVVLPSGTNYAINARVHDAWSSGNGNTYSVDALWSWSMDGNSWSPAYDDVMQGNIVVNGGGTVWFHVAPYFPGEVGSYLLQLDIQSGATVGIEDGLSLANITLHPNPAKDRFTIDLGDFHGELEAVQLIDAQGRMIIDQAVFQRAGGRAEVDVAAVPDGVYIVRLLTDKGVWNERLIITR